MFKSVIKEINGISKASKR